MIVQERTRAVRADKKEQSPTWPCWIWPARASASKLSPQSDSLRAATDVVAATRSVAARVATAWNCTFMNAARLLSGFVMSGSFRWAENFLTSANVRVVLFVAPNVSA